jgi:hypothetical protein
LPIAAVPRPFSQERWPLPLGAGPQGLLSFYNLQSAS